MRKSQVDLTKTVRHYIVWQVGPVRVPADEETEWLTTMNDVGILVYRIREIQ